MIKNEKENMKSEIRINAENKNLRIDIKKNCKDN